ncbi:Lcl C-terminal domain-containing protein [Alteromonas gilva]|uniref:DUF1566 domain-containing protein n=1 Tax=Alteromonas gilva TaxID=2987522 RepID=A0ABT5KZQ3_9ALTE|nr:DUF1566 domain-containing protein [Alteromonas gilva]MDC8829736.1 DUF1566 domain-containing protein [Alteromonas gilva]
MAFYRWCRLISMHVILASCMLVACGGGLSSEDRDETFAVNAGRDRSATEQSEVTLTAQVSYPSGDVTYSWSASPAMLITPSDTTASSATLTTPVATEDTDYVISVNVTDSAGQTASDSFTLTVTPENVPPTAVIAASQWPELAVGTYPAGVAITLDGSNSFDEDASTTPAIVTWQWQQTNGDDAIISNDTSTPSLVITTPIADDRQTLTFSLTVTDAEGATNTVSQSYTVLSASETTPTVSAGSDQAVFSGERIALRGAATSSVPAAYPIDTLWTFTGNAEPVIASVTAADTYAVAPQVDTETTLQLYLNAQDSFGNEITDSLTVVVRPFPVRVINDTGMTLQATNTTLASAHQNAWPGQDGQRGADVLAQSAVLAKAGRGEAGFDFTKLNSNGDEEDDEAAQFSCVRDNVTGLVWEVKTNDGGLRDLDHRYSWYAEENNGGAAGNINGPDTVCSITSCNTADYISAVNAAGLCGFYDWRLPTHQELLSIVHFGRAALPRVDSRYFPNTGSATATTLWYWTSQPGADGVSNDAAQNTWAIDFISGVDNFLNKSDPVAIRLVRAGR